MINNNRHNFINNKNEENRYKRYTEITNLWDIFKTFHYTRPGLRAGQILCIFEDWYLKTYGIDTFYIEDDKLILRLKEFINFFNGEN